MNIEGIDIKDIEFGEPIEEREGTFFDGYRYGLYKAHNIIDKQQKEIERLKNIINNTAVELEILLQSEDFELITMQLRNIVFRLKGEDKK